MAAHHLPRDLVRPSSGLTTSSKEEEEIEEETVASFSKGQSASKSEHRPY